MNAYQFTGIAVNNVIILPKEYNNKLVEVIVREIKDPPFRKRELLSPVEIDTKGWVWNREEANER